MILNAQAEPISRPVKVKPKKMVHYYKTFTKQYIRKKDFDNYLIQLENENLLESERLKI